MQTLGERIRQERKARQWSQADLAKRVGVTQAAISEIERDVPKASGIVIPIARAFNISVADLVGDEAAAVYTPADVPMEDDEFIFIPRYDVAGSCGPGVEVHDVNIIEGVPMSKAFLSASGIPAGGNLAVVEAAGDSMSPTIEDGEMLLVNVKDEEPKSTKIYLICIDGRLFIKRMIFTPGGWVMRSDNPDKSLYPDFLITADQAETVAVQGRVVWKSGKI